MVWFVTELLADAPQLGGLPPGTIPVAEAQTIRSFGSTVRPLVCMFVLLVKFAVKDPVLTLETAGPVRSFVFEAYHEV